MTRAVLALAVVAGVGTLAWATLDEGVALFQQDKYAEAADVLKKEIADHPTNTRAYMFLATVYERLSQWRDAEEAWSKFARLTESADERATGETMARKCRDRAAGKNPDDVAKTPGPVEPPSEFSKYEKSESIFFTVKTAHFTVQAKNRALLDLASKEAERHLQRIMDVFTPGRVWPHTIRISVYKDHREYVIEAGMPQWSGGGYSIRPDGTGGGFLRAIDLFACDPKGKYIPELLTKTLPHEMTHVVLHEYFGERAFTTLPRAVNEGLAMYAEEGTLVLYEKELADAVKRSVYIYKLPDLFAMTQYPPNVGLFYAQSASATRYLIEHMKAAEFRTFLEELKKGNPVNGALQSALMRTGDLLGPMETNWVAMLRTKADEYARNPTKKTDTTRPAPRKTPATETKTDTRTPPPTPAETRPEPYDPLKNEKQPPPGDDDEKDVVVEVK